MVEVAEMEMVLVVNSEYADIITNALVVWPTATVSLISGYEVARQRVTLKLHYQLLINWNTRLSK